ncbi:MAG TPA: sigma-70 family RNA polymerase sigma factor [Chloroflexota bacterium]|nr:sigma-70 family RNA polymerase sigma factor [Chloroflexota bacterium]
MAQALDTWTDVELVESAKGGNALAFAVLYDRHADRVYRHIAYRIGPKPDSEDLLQQTFLKAWQALPRYRVTDVPFVAWLLTIAHNAVISYFRSDRQHQPLEDGIGRIDEKADTPELVERHERQERVRRAIRALKPDFQQVVTMRYLEELDYSEIAHQLGKNEGAVRVTVHRALQQLRKELPDL